MTLLDDVRAAGLDVRRASGGRLQIRGPRAVQERLGGAIRRQRDQLLAELQEEATGPVQQGTLDVLIYVGPCDAEHRTCDHVWCVACGQWANDTGNGASCCPELSR